MEMKPKQYLVLLGSVTFVFTNFIACGAKMYQVSLENDMPEHKVAAEAKDTSSDQYGIHAPNGWVDIPISFQFSQTLTKGQKDGLMKAMKTWEIATGKQLFVLKGTDKRVGDSFVDLYSSLDDETNGHYLDNNWDKTGKPEVVLATTIWDNDGDDLSTIRTADIRFNTQSYILGDSFELASSIEKEVADMQSLATHELGHKLGLAHVSPDEDPYSIMNPSLYIGEGLANRKISRGDIKRIQKIYGCDGDACDVEKTFAKIESLDTSMEDEYTYETASIERETYPGDSEEVNASDGDDIAAEEESH